ncbi:Zinc finger protein klf1 [Golovinomyces cichoracearum]|uniref:Zinc finger protein klf1 n=1 Tax=Golovinomyces cichoracearum TaxID=62708 RepID=A0A420J2Q9_9PEZI|nr:Zinc finger protein klf1 [Golovinomyces cichoracearum]
MLAHPTTSTSSIKKNSLPAVPEKKYKCQYCNRAFSRSEHRSRHERSHTKERPFQCMKCRSTFVRRDLLLRHDRTVHAKDGGIPLHSDVKRRAGSKSRAVTAPKSAIAIDPLALEQIEASSDGMVDLETAAMLMTDLHQKATAVMRSAGVGPYENRTNIAISHSPTILEQPMISYSSWDINSEAGLESTSNINSSKSSLPSSQSSLTSVLHSSSHYTIQNPNNDSMKYNGWMSAFSPTVSTSPTKFRKLSSELQKETIKTPHILNNEDRNIILESIRINDSERAIPESFRLPDLISLNHFLSSYFGLFHHHLPFLHPASFKPTQVSPSLLLAVLSIGALYVFDQKQAYICHIGSKVLVNQFLQYKENFSSRKCPLWTMQSSLLNMIFASWSGDPKGLEWACSIKSLLANMVAGNRYELKLRTEAREGQQPTRTEWVEDEGCRRTYYAVYIFFGLLTLAYNHTPAIGFNEFEDLALPSSESLWSLKIDDDIWEEEMKNSTSAPSFMDAYDKLFQGDSLRCSTFATRIMINALFLEVWCHKRSSEALQDVATEFKIRQALETWEKSLILQEAEYVAVPIGASHKGHPLISNAMAMFRNSRVCLEVDLKPVQEALRYHNFYEVAAAMSNARDKVKRSNDMLKVIEECYDYVEKALLHGTRWLAQSSATNWGVEHPLCGLDIIIVLSLWLHRLENDEEPPNEKEIILYNKIRHVFNDDLMENYGTKLSSKVAFVWGSMHDEVVVWGITKLMGDSFRLHSQVLAGYENGNDDDNFSTPSMSSQGIDENDENSNY